jgi:transposase
MEGMATHTAPRRDFHGLEVRRQQAARLFAAGRETQGAIARLLRVSRQSVMRWYRAWRTGGRGALRAAGRAGRKPRLSREQMARVEAALRQGPRAHGFHTSLWTLPRVARVIKRLTGVQYHPGHVWRLLGAMDWTLQRPAKRAKERNDAAIQHWISTRWPTVKKTLGAAAPGSSSRTRAASRSGRRSAAPGRPVAKPPS